MNRFSKDVGFLDDLLPLSFINYLVVSSLNLQRISSVTALNFAAVNEVHCHNNNGSCCQLLDPPSCCLGDGSLSYFEVVLSQDSTRCKET